MTVAIAAAMRITRAARAMTCAVLLLAAWPLALVATANADDGVKTRPADCRLAAPSSWRGWQIEWIGPCTRGAANGAGVAIATAGGRPPERFYGIVTSGEMTEGVFDIPDGYRPARFEKGEPVALDDRNQIIAAFRVAASAARDVSSRFKAARNTQAARDYAEAAEHLENQMD